MIFTSSLYFAIANRDLLKLLLIKQLYYHIIKPLSCLDDFCLFYELDKLLVILCSAEHIKNIIYCFLSSHAV